MLWSAPWDDAANDDAPPNVPGITQPGEGGGWGGGTDDGDGGDGGGVQPPQ